MKMLLLMLLCCYCACYAQNVQNGAVGTDCTDQVSDLTRSLQEATDEINTLKVLSLATATLINNPNNPAAYALGTASNLELGTAGNPALSCEQIKEARDVQSGWYYVRGESNTFHKVYCDMDTFGGGWTRFGKDNMNSLWNFIDEDQQTSTIDIISDSDLLKMQRLHFTEFRVLTDVEFRLQADDSINPSFISAVLLPDLTPHQVRIIGSADHTHILFDDDDDQLECFSGGGSNKCGTGGLPPVGTKSHKLFFQAAFFGPRASGASAHENQWQRNRYTWSGDYYFILAR